MNSRGQLLEERGKKKEEKVVKKEGICFCGARCHPSPPRPAPGPAPGPGPGGPLRAGPLWAGPALTPYPRSDSGSCWLGPLTPTTEETEGQSGRELPGASRWEGLLPEKTARVRWVGGQPGVLPGGRQQGEG